jgi:predicted RNase H-like nuclease
VIGIGVDGCRAGWFGVRISGRSKMEGRLFRSFAELHAEWHDAGSVILIDIPIGLPDSTSCRTCDSLARRYLGGTKASSVFNPPTRAALDATSWEQAAALNEDRCGKRLSKQTWHIMPKIREIDAFLQADRQRQQWIREAHPEVLFQALNGGDPLTATKKTAAGQQQRLRILEQHAIGCRRLFGQLCDRHPRQAVQPDDILDAMVAAVVAAGYRDRLDTLPPEPPLDTTGLRCEIVLPRPPDFEPIQKSQQASQAHPK